MSSRPRALVDELRRIERLARIIRGRSLQELERQVGRIRTWWRTAAGVDT